MLKKYEDHQKAIVPEKEKPIPSGVACTEMVCAKCVRKHRARERPISEYNLTKKQNKEKQEKWHLEHEVNLVPCKGEMMIWQPEINHPELPLRRASCSLCGWLGWV